MPFKTQTRKTIQHQIGTYHFYYDYLTLLYLHRYTWLNLPHTINRQFLEKQLLSRGSIAFFEHEIGGLLCLPFSTKGQLNVYGEPINWQIHSANGRFYTSRNSRNSVIMYDNYLHQSHVLYIHQFATRLAELDQIVTVNLKAQKTPVMVVCSEEQRLSMLNLYQQYEGNHPFIQGNKNIDFMDFKVLKTDAPYVADKILADKKKIWDEIITFFGLNNANTEKKERLVTDEANANNEIVSAGLSFGLDARTDAIEKINKMFGTNIDIKVNENLLDNHNINEMGGLDG